MSLYKMEKCVQVLILIIMYKYVEFEIIFICIFSPTRLKVHKRLEVKIIYK